MRLEKQKQTPEQKRQKARWSRIFKIYGLTKEQYDDLDTGSCPACLRTWNDTVRPAIDHDHVSGEIRGLLCGYCNHYRVGRHRDPALLFRIAEYLTPPFTGFIIPTKPKKKKKKPLAKKSLISMSSPLVTKVSRIRKKKI